VIEEPVPIEQPTIVTAATTSSSRRGGKSQKSPRSRASICSPDKPPKKVPVVKLPPKESDLYSFNPEPKHDYGTRRKRLKKQFDEFITTDDLFKRSKKDVDSEEEEDEQHHHHQEQQQESQSSSQQTHAHPTLPMVYVSGLGSSEECDEVIDMTSIPNQRRRLTTRRILIDMTPSLNGRPPVVTEVRTEAPKKKPQVPKPKEVETESIYNTTLSNVSHSRLTRVGDEFQASIPELSSPPPNWGEMEQGDEPLPLLGDDISDECQLAALKRELTFLAFSSAQVIVAVIPNSNSRRIRRSNAPASCILADKTIRARLLSEQLISPPECPMSIEMKKTLFPRLCVAIRRVVLVRQRRAPDEQPVLFFRPEEETESEEGAGEVIESPLWGCDFLHEDESSDSESEWGERHPRARDMFAMMADRFGGDHSMYLEVTDGTQV
jgi:hypothetical protein